MTTVYGDCPEHGTRRVKVMPFRVVPTHIRFGWVLETDGSGAYSTLPPAIVYQGICDTHGIVAEDEVWEAVYDKMMGHVNNH